MPPQNETLLDHEGRISALEMGQTTIITALGEIKANTDDIIGAQGADREESRDRIKTLEVKMRGLLWFVPALLGGLGLWLKSKIGL